MGGFRNATPGDGSQLPTFVPGTSMDAGLFAVAVESGWMTDLAPWSRWPSKGESYRLVPLLVTNRGNHDFGAAVQLERSLVWWRQRPGAAALAWTGSF